MFSSRAVARASRGVKVNNPALRNNVRRFAEARPQEQRPGIPSANSGSSSSGSSSSGSASHAMLYGTAGGVTASVLVFYTWYQFSGIGKTAKSLQQMKGYVDSTTEKLKVQLKEKTPEPTDAINALRDMANQYAMFIPGGRQYVDAVFKELDIIRNKHSEEVDNLVKEAYGELREISKKGISFETASDTWQTLSKYLQQLSSLAVDAGQDILDNHPELKNRLGGSFDQLKELGDNLGPEAKKQVEQTYKDVQDVIKQGIQWDTVDKVRNIAQDKVQALKQLRDKSWQQGFEQIQPMLKNNPQAKQAIEENVDTLKNGNVTETFDKIKQALTSGDNNSLNEYIQSAKQKGEQLSSSGLSNWLQMIPGGSQILPQLQKLQQIAQSKGSDADQVAKETMSDIKQVLEKRSKQVEDLAKDN